MTVLYKAFQSNLKGGKIDKKTILPSCTQNRKREYFSNLERDCSLLLSFAR